MKKIGILTFHFADNFGAVLQAHALYTVINSLPGCEAEIINYIPPIFQYAKYGDNILCEIKRQEKREKLDQFLREYCGINGPVFYTLNNNMEYDYFCVGSDQIWNTASKFYNDYFLKNVSSSKKKISYAASIGLPLNDPRLRKTVLMENLPSFESISVREDIYVSLVEKITKKECKCVLDPTLLLPASHYENFISKENLRERKFIFFFWLNNDNRLMRGVEFVNAISRKYKLPIVHSLSSMASNVIVNDYGSMFYEGIEDFLWYIKNAEYVITNSYHGTIFSILFRKPFYTFVVNSMRSRIDTLCHKLHIDDRVVEGYLSVENMDKDIDYGEMFSLIEKEKIQSLNYLKQALDISSDYLSK